MGRCSLQAKGDLDPAIYNYLEGPSFITYENKSDHTFTLSFLKSSASLSFSCNDKLHERVHTEGAGKACPTKQKVHQATKLHLLFFPFGQSMTKIHTQKNMNTNNNTADFEYPVVSD